MIPTIDPDDVSSIEKKVRKLTANMMAIARERAAHEAAVESARETLERAQAELPAVEATAKERRRSQHDARRGRAELERQLRDLLDAEGLARARRLQCEQRAQSFRAAAAFAASARADALAMHDEGRAERERLVEERALREAAAGDSRASEELAEEQKLAALRSEIETHVTAERELEATLGAERDRADQRARTLRETIERAKDSLREATARLEEIDSDRDRLEGERVEAGTRLREVGTRARGEIEARIDALRDAQRQVVAELEEQERLLATMITNEERAAREALDEQNERERRELHERAARAAFEAAPQPAYAPAASAAPAANAANAAQAASSAAPQAVTAAPPEQPSVSRRPKPELQPASVRHDEASGGLRNLFDNVLRRRKPAMEEPVDDGPSVADRIARDFGLLSPTGND